MKIALKRFHGAKGAAQESMLSWHVQSPGIEPQQACTHKEWLDKQNIMLNEVQQRMCCALQQYQSDSTHVYFLQSRNFPEDF